MKKLSAACMILGLSLFAGGCSNDQIDDHIISLQDKISDVTASDSTEQEDQEPSTEERVYMDELTGTLLDFDGTHLTISSNGETYVFDVSQTRLECKYGVVSSDQVSVIYQGQLSGTDISTISPIKITDKYHNETPLEDRTLKGKVKSLTSNALVIVTEKGNTVTFPVTGVRQYYKKGFKAGKWVYVHFRGKFINETLVSDKQYDGSFTKVISVSTESTCSNSYSFPRTEEKRAASPCKDRKCQHRHNDCHSADHRLGTDCFTFLRSCIFQRRNGSWILCKHYLYR